MRRQSLVGRRALAARARGRRRPIDHALIANRMVSVPLWSSPPFDVHACMDLGLVDRRRLTDVELTFLPS